MHARTSSSKALHKHTSASSTKLASKRNHSPSPDRSAHNHNHHHAPAATATSTAASTPGHRRSTSEAKLSSRDSSSANLRKNASHSSLVGKRNRSHVEIAKKSKSAANIKRSASHRDVNKYKGTGAKGSVHFALGDNDGDDDDDDEQEDEWVDASGSASPYLSRRGSVASGVQSPGKTARDEAAHSASSSRPHTPREPHQLQKQQSQESAAEHESSSDTASDKETIQHKEYLTSRLLKRTPSYSAPHMSKETVLVQPRGSPDSVRASLYGTPKNTTAIVGSDQTAEVTSRFVNGSGGGAEPGSFYTPTRSPARRSDNVRPSKSLTNITDKHRDSTDTNAAADDEDDSALAPRTTRPARGGVPAETSRTQQKLNLQRASSSMEPSQPGGGGGVVGASPLVGVNNHEGRDLRISRQLERTGMEYLVVRRYQNPIARSINRLSQLPGANKTQPIRQHKSNGVNGGSAAGLGHAKKPSYGLSQSLADLQKSRPTTPATAAAAARRPTSIRTNGANSSYGDGNNNNNDEDSRYDNDGDDGGLAAILRNLWDKNMDLSASQD
ncbi:uncharacterized protein B0I36DRAFT_333574 [Microdochium trichocladiopsis]|uniref:TORC1 subunit TCO89 n=1 Tax=Microdochium trichocladiopsis TaxID=1682393 RepID=A0A9P8XX47_9PEZI|nr:uncharacterized protein B0I36DRAFT_333574 [Microdochium trichocladiopsis]KAH7020987.1 hypothetical protein B0I36DRAFT_333574 [Microdochium trichocladiopsis]